jgi:ADP-ribose pyrophosphatase
MAFEEISRQPIFKGRVFDIERVQVKLPDDREAYYEMVTHPGAVSILPLDELGRILFVRQFRPAAWQEVLELPAGTLEKGEDPLECALRELREETGVGAHQLQKLGAFFLAPGYSSERLHMFLARDLYKAPLQADLDEFLNVEAIPVAKAYEMARQGEFKDAKTLAGLFLAEPFLTK